MCFVIMHSYLIDPMRKKGKIKHENQYLSWFQNSLAEEKIDFVLSESIHLLKFEK